MILGIGVDMVSLSRIKEIYGKYGQKLLQRICTAEEIAKIEHRDVVEYIAKRFAAKEAYTKALGFGISDKISWQDIEVVSDGGRPFFSPKTKYVNDYNTYLSITDEDGYALAFVVIEKK